MVYYVLQKDRYLGVVGLLQLCSNILRFNYKYTNNIAAQRLWMEHIVISIWSNASRENLSSAVPEINYTVMHVP